LDFAFNAARMDAFKPHTLIATGWKAKLQKNQLVGLGCCAVLNVRVQFPGQSLLSQLEKIAEWRQK
jgi:hypothetical protein